MLLLLPVFMELFHLASAVLCVVVANTKTTLKETITKAYFAGRPLEFSELQTLLTESKPLIVISCNISKQFLSSKLQPSVFT